MALTKVCKTTSCPPLIICLHQLLLKTTFCCLWAPVLGSSLGAFYVISVWLPLRGAPIWPIPCPKLICQVAWISPNYLDILSLTPTGFFWIHWQNGLWHNRPFVLSNCIHQVESCQVADWCWDGPKVYWSHLKLRNGNTVRPMKNLAYNLPERRPGVSQPRKKYLVIVCLEVVSMYRVGAIHFRQKTRLGYWL